MKPVNIIEPAVPRFGHDRQTPPVTSHIGGSVFDTPLNDRVTRHSDTVRVCNNDRPFKETALFDPGGAGHFPVSVEREKAGVNRIVERVASAGDDGGDASTHRALTDFKFAFAAN